MAQRRLRRRNIRSSRDQQRLTGTRSLRVLPRAEAASDVEGLLLLGFDQLGQWFIRRIDSPDAWIRAPGQRFGVLTRTPVSRSRQQWFTRRISLYPLTE